MSAAIDANGALRHLGRMEASAEFFGSCFVAGTKVLTPTSEKNIESIVVGDTVVSADPESGEIAHHQVKSLFKTSVPVVLNIKIGEATITCSPEHPFWVPGEGWQEAGKLKPGTLLLNKQGQALGIESIERREGHFTVYNIEVEGLHAYFVSELAILVHNKALKVHKPHLPQRGGIWDGIEGESGWYSDNTSVQSITNGEPVIFKDQYPDFSKWALDEVEMQVTGKPKTDDRLANKAYAEKTGMLKKNGKPNRSESERYVDQNNLTWHHVPETNKMQLLPRDLHDNVIHSGGASQARQRLGTTR
ncbi:polymorphic toxin-type HINT domain-containing protein [Nostoc sp.]|uniref:polymorphic toxin-type HINT domain-containing protein n=1 Tax=Nostoc sp. TaxID=1180 RepID=UPI002FF5014A